MVLTLAVDPGQATGVAIGRYLPDEPWKLVHADIVHGGLLGFMDWWMNDLPSHELPVAYDETVVEKFILRAAEAVPDVEALRIEGFIVGQLAQEPIWQLRTAKSAVPDQVLKNHDLWQTGKMVNHTDGRDANDAIIHSLVRMKNIRHIPTLAKYFGDEE